MKYTKKRTKIFFVNSNLQHSLKVDSSLAHFALHVQLESRQHFLRFIYIYHTPASACG